MAKGTIKNLVNTYGFIDQDENEENVFFLQRWVENVPSSGLRKGMRVEYETQRTEKGLQAIEGTIRVIRFLNPYNFVRYLEQPRPEDHVLGDSPPPPHDRYVGLTGRITCTVEAKTPLFISDSHAVEEDDNGHKSYRFFQYDGKPALPASSLRGMVRSVFEAVTNSCFSTIHDRQLDFRLEARKAPSLRPAVVKKLPDSEKQEDGEVLLLKSAWVHHSVIEKAAEGVLKGHLKEAPWREDAPFGSYFHKVLTDQSIPIQAQILEGVRKREEEFGGNSYRFPFNEVVEIKRVGQPGQKLQRPQNNLFWGYLKITGPNVVSERWGGELELRKHDERFFYWDGSSQCKAKIPWQDVPGRKNAVQRYNAVREDQQDPANQQLPYVTYLPNETLSVNDLVWVKVEDGVVKQIGSVCVPKFRYRHGILDLLPKHLHPCSSHEKPYRNLCPACRMFGWVWDSPPEDADRVAYAGRVRFSHGKAREETLDYEDPIPLAILSTPKPTTTQFYLLDADGKPDFEVNYDKEGAQLRGRKFYRHHGEADSKEYQSGERSNQNRTVRGALKKDATFTFTVDFENLARVELGALLYALELEDDLVHRLGYAKPLGFGSVKVTVDKLETVNWCERLQSLNAKAGWQEADRAEIDDLKKDFLQTMRDLYGEEFDDKVLADLHALLGKPPELPIHYPRPTRQFKPDHPQYEWFVGNKKRIEDKQKSKRKLPEPVTLDLASKDKRGLPLIDKDGHTRG
ncbi:MAG: TIGR03986 family type III CRISPR-associated RAMP protein [Anaerolineae bacterium]